MGNIYLDQPPCLISGSSPAQRVKEAPSNHDNHIFERYYRVGICPSHIQLI